MKEQEVLVKARTLRNRKKRYRIAKTIFLVLLFLMVVIWAVLSFINNGYFFTLSMDPAMYFENHCLIYDDPTYKVYRTKINVKGLDSFNNFSKKWFPANMENEGGSHNGDNYIAYTFFLENQGDHEVDYWYEINIADSIRDLDEAIRVRVYQNGEYTDYAKMGARGVPESGTTAFLSDTQVALVNVKNLEAGQTHKFTIVIWIEGDDPECTDNLLGGEIKLTMNFKIDYNDIVDNNESGEANA